MNSTVPVRLFSRTVCLVVFLLSAEAGAGIDSPGRVSFEFLAEPDAVYQSLDQVPEDAWLSHVDAWAYFSTDASIFKDTGVRIWAGFELEGPDGGRHAMLILDLDLQQSMWNTSIPLEGNTIRAQYLETRNDRVLFEGYPLVAEAQVWDLAFDYSDDGSLQGEFNCIFVDPSDHGLGSRVLVRGHLLTDAQARHERSDPEVYHQNDTYVESGCESDVYVEDDYDDSGCEGDSYDSEYEDTGCGGDTYDNEYEDSGCGGSDYDDDYDYGGSSDCEGDSYDSSYSDSSSCEGDSYDSYDSDYDSADCEGDEAYAAVLKPAPRRRRRPNPLRAIMRMFPEIAGISFIVYMKRRFRAGRL